MATDAAVDILIADDERSIRWVLSEALSAQGHRIHEARSGTEALARLDGGDIDLALIDIRMPELSGLDVVSKAQEFGCKTTLIVMTAETTMTNAVEAMKRGAYDYLTKPFDLDVVKHLVDRALQARQLSSRVDGLRSELRKKYEVGVEIVGQSPVMQEIYKLVGKVAASGATVLVQGESGTGKELIARALHYHSPRWEEPFVAINCSAIPRDLLESELFGYERGAFTGAAERRIGKIEQARRGTLFLDEIGDMPGELQAKLLRVLQEREYERVGGRDTLTTEMRVVAATNQNLVTAVQEGTFREDLFFRLNVVPISVPPLRERAGDIPDLIRFFLSKISREFDTAVDSISPQAERLLIDYGWPGNVRELENALVRAAVIAAGKTLLPSDFDLGQIPMPQRPHSGNFHETVRERVEEEFANRGDNDPVDLYGSLLAEFERPLLETTLDRAGGNQVRAAQILGINRNTLRKKLVSLGLASGGRRP